MDASRMVAEYITRLAQETGDHTMEIQKVLTLIALRQHPDMSQTDLPRHTLVERSANSRNLWKLGEGGAGLVEQYEDPENRRFKRVRLSPKGGSTHGKGRDRGNAALSIEEVTMQLRLGQFAVLVTRGAFGKRPWRHLDVFQMGPRWWAIELGSINIEVEV